MGTRSTTTVFCEHTDQPLLSMYRQYDGYWDGHGNDLKEFLRDFKIVNGLSSGQGSPVANGMGCLAAQLVAHFKEGPGGIYIQSLDGKEGYHYEIRGKVGSGVHLTAYVYGDVRYEGPISEFDPGAE